MPGSPIKSPSPFIKRPFLGLVPLAERDSSLPFAFSKTDTSWKVRVQDPRDSFILKKQKDGHQVSLFQSRFLGLWKGPVEHDIEIGDHLFLRGGFLLVVGVDAGWSYRNPVDQEPAVDIGGQSKKVIFKRARGGNNKISARLDGDRIRFCAQAPGYFSLGEYVSEEINFEINLHLSQVRSYSMVVTNQSDLLLPLSFDLLPG